MKIWKLKPVEWFILIFCAILANLGLSALLNHFNKVSEQDKKNIEDSTLRIQRASSVSRANFESYAKKEGLDKIDLEGEFTSYVEYNLFSSNATPSYKDIQIKSVSFAHKNKKCHADVEVTPSLSDYLFHARLQNVLCDGLALKPSNYYLRRWDGGGFVFTNFSLENGILKASTRFEKMALFIRNE